MLKIPLALEAAAVVVGALSGGIHAVHRGGDIVGIFILALATGLGGGILRDILMGVGTPAALAHPYYLIVVAGAALVTLFLARALARIHRLLDLLDALLIGLWTVMGTGQAVAHHLPMTSAIFLGTVTAVGGGMIRDVLSGKTPAVMTKGELYATAAFLAAVVDVVLMRGLKVPALLAEFFTIATAAGLRLTAMRWHLTAPTPDDMSRILSGKRSRDDS
jgi:uncharacterized membrane protein YeiH